MQFDVDASVTRTQNHKGRKTTRCLGLITSVNEGLGVPWLWRPFGLCSRGARTDHMDDYGVCEWSHCSPCALLLSC